MVSVLEKFRFKVVPSCGISLVPIFTVRRSPGSKSPSIADNVGEKPTDIYLPGSTVQEQLGLVRGPTRELNELPDNAPAAVPHPRIFDNQVAASFQRRLLR